MSGSRKLGPRKLYIVTLRSPGREGMLFLSSPARSARDAMEEMAAALEQPLVQVGGHFFLVPDGATAPDVEGSVVVWKYPGCWQVYVAEATPGEFANDAVCW